VQTYSGGEEVAWIESIPASGEEPEHPAPTVQLVAAGGPATGSATTPDAEDEDSDTLAIVALVVGAAGLVIGALGFATARAARTAATRT
jgi:hypothetical protein